MPSIGAFHSFYWKGSSNVVTPPTSTEAGGGYPAWQASVVGFGLGSLQPWWERWYHALVRWVRLWRGRSRVTPAELQWLERVALLTDTERLVLGRVLRAIESPAYYAASAAVRDTAHTLGFASPAAWRPYSRMLKANAGRAENIFRHVKACEHTRSLLSSTLSNAEVNLVVELAYCGYAVKGRYFD